MSVYRRGKSWYINVHIGGRRINRLIPGVHNKRQALVYQEELKTLQRHRLVRMEPAEEHSFDELATAYIQYTKTVKSARTYQLYKDDYTNHLQQFFGNLILDEQEITNSRVLDFQEQQKAKGYSNTTVNIHIKLMRQILRWGADKNFIRKDVVENLKFPKLEEIKKLHAFVPADVYDDMVKAFDLKGKNRLAALGFYRIIIARNTGMRPAELQFLSWPDVDFKGKIIRIKAKQEWKPKKSEERTIPMNKTVYEILNLLYKQRTGPWVFSSHEKPVKDIRKSLRSLAKNSGLPKITPYMLRHSFATHLLASGVDVETVRQLMGHKDLKTTARYLHSLSERLRSAVNKLDS